MEQHQFPVKCDTGVFQASLLSDRGLSRRNIAAEVRHGRLLSLRHGWYAKPDANPVVRRAVASGGILTCVSLMELMLGRTVTAPLHVRSNRTLRTSNTATHMCSIEQRMRRNFQPPPRNGLDDISNATRVLIGCGNSLQVESLLEGAVNQRLIPLDEINVLRSIATTREDRILKHINGKCESFLEVVLRRLLRQAGIPFTQQFWIPELSVRSDFKVGKRLLIEADGRQFHSGLTDFHRDRVRDALLARHGYRTLRLSYQQIMFTPQECIRTVSYLMHTGEHR